MAKQEFRVHGMHCKSCEVVIERELKNHPGVTSVTVSHHDGLMRVETQEQISIREGEINELLAKHDYRVTNNRQQAVRKRMSWNWGRIGGALVFVLSLYIILDRIGLLRLSPSSAEPASLLGVLAIGLLASVSSCTAVVGGLVAAVSSAVAKQRENLTKRERIRPHILFNVGRVGGFFVFGALIGSLGSALQLGTTMNGLFVIAIAVLMMVIGVNLMDVFPVPVVSMPKWLAHRIHDLSESTDPKAPMLLGAMTFFLPCGFTQSMQLFALTLQSPLQSGIVMAVFALGTAPVLLGIGSATSFASKEHIRMVTQAAGAFVLVLGLSNMLNGFALVGISPQQVFATSAKQSDDIVIKNGRQAIEMDVTSRGAYEPNVLTVKKGVPVEWTINGADFMGCANTLVLPAFGVQTFLKTGENMVEFTPTKTGKFTFSCSMGMIRGTMIVTE